MSHCDNHGVWSAQFSTGPSSRPKLQNRQNPKQDPLQSKALAARTPIIGPMTSTDIVFPAILLSSRSLVEVEVEMTVAVQIGLDSRL